MKFIKFIINLIPIRKLRRKIRSVYNTLENTKNSRHSTKFLAELALEYGYERSLIQKECIDKHNNPIPWYTYPAIEYLDSLDFSDKLVFEFGCGNSSLFWAKKCLKVTSVENNPEWHEKIASKAPENLNIILCEDEKSYVNSIYTQKTKYDVIVIDGVYRDKCAESAINNLADDGIIIFDNSDRISEFKDYSDAQQVLLRKNLLQVDMSGFGPGNQYCWTTSIFFTRDYTCKPSKETLPVRPICGLIMEGQ